MKKYIFGCAIAISGLAVPALSAQDYCCPSQYDCSSQYDPWCCEADFDGFYIGGNVGVISHTAHRNDLDGLMTDNAGWSTIDTNVTAGVQLGYDWLCNCTVFGLVIDWSWANIDHKLIDEPNVSTVDRYIKSEFDWFTTIRARAGVTCCDSLWYITAGAVVARFETTWADIPSEFKHHDTRWGWTGGFGAEFLVCGCWSLGAEFLFMQFADDTRTFSDSLGTFSFSHSDSAWIGRILLNYRFGDLCSCFW